MARIIFFDVETRKWAKDLHDDEQVGWDKLRRGEGGASAICLYDTRDNWAYMYDDHSAKQAAQHLETADLVVGFSSRDFDIPVIEGLIGRKLQLKMTYDICVTVFKANADRGLVGRKGEFTLDAISKRNLGRGKINHGSNAKKLAQTGQWGKLFNYCMDDVHLTRDLFARICKTGGLNSLNGTFLTLPPLPEWIAASMAQE
jgi:hypothetical protein